MANSDSQRKLGLRVGGTCCLFTMILLSIGSLLPLEYGLTINSITRQVNGDSVYHGGRHLIGPWNGFISFPSTLVTVKFQNSKEGNGVLETRTKDGLALKLELSFQYRLLAEKLPDLFKLANLQYEPLFIRNARDVLLKAAADYEAFEYWQDREKIGLEMAALLDNRLNKVYATCHGLQVLVIALPEEFETSIVQTQVQQQMVSTKLNEQKAARIEADTTVLAADYHRNVTVTRSSAEALFTQKTKIARAEANQRMLEVEAKSMEYVQSKLGLGADQMVAYQQFQALYGMDNASFIYGMDNAMLQMPMMGSRTI